MPILLTDQAKGFELKGAEDDKDLVRKEVVSFEIKDAEKGEVEAIIATFDVIDKDFDVILDTAIPAGSKVKMSSYGHDLMGGLFGGGGSPVGKGAIFPEESKAIFRGKLFLQTQGGRETFEILKEMGKDQEWSFGFRVMGSEIPDENWRKRGAQRILTKLDCFEVSPVLRGAGVGTRTLAVKEETPAPAAVADPPAVTDPPAKSAEELATEQAAAEQKARDGEREAADQRARTRAAVEEFHRVHRTHRRLGLT